MNAFLIDNQLLDPASSDIVAYVVESNCRFARPLRYPGAVEIGLASVGLGNSSLTWHFGAFLPGSPAAAAEATFVQVTIDRPTGRPVPIPKHWRDRIAG
jgi:acyl-CoA thioester hydrolase